MTFGIIDSAYRDPAYMGLGASWLRWELEAKHGQPPVSPADADIVLVTAQSQQAVGDVRRELKRQGVDWRTRPVVLGGAAAFAPAVYGNMIACACVGEGRRFVGTLVRDGLDAAKRLPEAWVPGETREVIPDEEFPWDCPPIKYQDGTTRLWASRGCRRKCGFCQTGWQQPYHQNPDLPGLYRLAARLHQQGHSVFFTTNDQTELDLRRIPPTPHFSATVAGLRQIMEDPSVIAGTKGLRVGVEGVSERLRTAVGKPITTVELVDCTARMLERGLAFRWFMIAGLPGETGEDYEDLKGAILAIKSRCPKGAVMLHFHAYIPQPATPLGVLPLEDGYWERFQEFRRWFFDGPGFTRRVQIMACGQPPNRLKRAAESMAATEAELRAGWFERDNPNWRVRGTAAVERRRELARHYMMILAGDGHAPSRPQA